MAERWPKTSLPASTIRSSRSRTTTAPWPIWTRRAGSTTRPCRRFPRSTRICCATSIDQQLWLSKGKELGITGETELVKKLDEIRKQYNLEIDRGPGKGSPGTGRLVRGLQGQHPQPDHHAGSDAAGSWRAHPDDAGRGGALLRGAQARLCAAGERAAERDSDLHRQGRRSRQSGRRPRRRPTISRPGCTAGGDFAQLARSFSDGPTAHRKAATWANTSAANWASCLRIKTFSLNSGQYTDPILTRQGYIILKVVQHTPGGPRPFKDVSRMSKRPTT